jgi:hypothetical protein
LPLRQLPEPILSGKLSIRWRMKDIDPEAATRNGFIVLSSDEDAQASVFAGAWTGSQKLAIFEGISQFRKATLKPFQPGMEMNCQLDLDLDSRKATLTINGVSEQRSSARVSPASTTSASACVARRHSLPNRKCQEDRQRTRANRHSQVK